MSIEIDGHCQPRYAFVRDLLAEELASGRALGQAIAVVVEGETVAHVWGGFRDKARARPWSADTLACLFSASKPLAAACVLKLIERGRIELDAPIANYWPEFAQAGKEAATVRHALAHLAGVPIAEAAPPRAVYDRAALAHAVAVQAPLFAPGTQLCFHSFTHGILSGEIVRRVDGRPLPRFFREEVATPGELDVAFALNEAEQARCAQMVLVPDNPLFRMMTDPATPLGRGWRPMPWDELNSAAFRGSDFPSIGAHGSALGLARFYGHVASASNAPRGWLDAGVVREALTEQRHEPDAFMGAPVRMGLSFMLANEVFPFTGRPTAFGQPGLGGIAGIGDAGARVGIGVVGNRLSAGLENPLLDRLLPAVVARR